MGTRLVLLLAVISLVVGISISLPLVALGQGYGATQSVLEKQFAFRNAMRMLWEDHITWTRLYIVSVAAGLPDKDATAQRLLQNQTDIGNAIKSFYGTAAGDKLTVLLRAHILTAADLLAAAKVGDTAKVNDAKTRWYANADEIAAFLSSANPKSWPLAEMKSHMRGHLDLTLEEATARLKGDWPSDVAAYSKVHEQILKMADMLSGGIISQFPEKFQAGGAIDQGHAAHVDSDGYR